jgi:adhesin transport system membrane fusion protein
LIDFPLFNTNIKAFFGIVKDLKVTTVGGVLRSGEQLMEISPSQGGVILEAKIAPVDIGRLTSGMLTTIKLDA